jgi:hypothetical protein
LVMNPEIATRLLLKRQGQHKYNHYLEKHRELLIILDLNLGRRVV